MPTNSLSANNLASGSAAFYLPSFNPPVVIGDYALDNGMISFNTLCDRIYVCTGPITDFNSVISTGLGYNSFTPGGALSAFSGVNNGVPSGRTVTSVAFTNGQITTSGQAICWAAVSFANSQLLAWGVLAGDVQVTAGQQFGLPSFTIHEPAYFSGIGLTSQLTANSLASQSAGLGMTILYRNLFASSLASGAAGLDLAVLSKGYLLTAFSFVPAHLNSIGTPTLGFVGPIPITASNFAPTAANSLGTPTLVRIFKLTATNLATGAAGFASNKPVADAFTLNIVITPASAPTGTTRNITVTAVGGTSPFTYNTPTASGITFTPVSGSPGQWTFVY